MRRTFNILRSALVLSALFLLRTVVAQNDVLELLPGARVLKIDEETGIHRLIDNVSFKYQGNIMYCDSAHYFQRFKTVKAYGHVHINKKDTLNLFCDSMLYDGRTKKAILWGNVRARDNEYKLTTDTLHYDAGASQAAYHYGGKVESITSKEVLTSKIGYFYPNSKNFFFSKKVVYKGSDLKMTTDTLQYLYGKRTAYFYGPTFIESKDAEMFCHSGWYNTKTEEGSLQKEAWLKHDKEYFEGDTLIYRPALKEYIGKGHVYFRDTTQDISFRGDYAFSSDSMNYSFVTGHAIATKFMDKDTMHIHADTLYNMKMDSIQMVKAYRNGKIYSRKMQSVADSIVFNELTNKVELHFNPIVWSEHAELKGRFIDMDVTDSSVHKVNIYDNANILMEVAVDSFYNQIAGKKIVAYFKNNDLLKSVVTGNAQTIFFPEDETKTDSLLTRKRMGMNRLYASQLVIYIDSNQLTGITYEDQPDGAFYPLEKINREELFIPNFNWKNALRPRSLDDIIHDKTTD